MFLLRCLFWLGIVYASIAWRSGAFSPSTLSPATARMATGEAVTALGDICRRRPSLCLADAARLTALIERDETDAASPSRDDASDVAVPRRHARARVLTREP